MIREAPAAKLERQLQAAYGGLGGEIMNIRTSPANVLTTDELIIATTFLGLMADHIVDLHGEELLPESVKADKAACEVELSHRLRADKERRLRLAEQRLESLKTPDEKRRSTQAEIDALRADLGYQPATRARKTAPRGGR
jgi:hypothetical protein